MNRVRVAFVVVMFAMVGLLGYVVLLHEDSRADCRRAAYGAPVRYLPASWTDQAHCFTYQHGAWRDLWSDR